MTIRLFWSKDGEEQHEAGPDWTAGYCCLDSAMLALATYQATWVALSDGPNFWYWNAELPAQDL